MKARQLIEGAAFGPETLKAMSHALDEAWDSMTANMGSDPHRAERSQLNLARALLSVAENAARDVEALKTVPDARVLEDRGRQGVPMLQQLRAVQHWPLWIRLAITGVALAAAYLVQIPLERNVPGEPFLLFLLVVIGATLAFGARIGFVTVAVSTLLSILFFEPIGSFALYHASDLIGIELYAIVAGGCVLAFAKLGTALIAAANNSEALNVSERNKSMLLRELVHGVANNFTAVATLISMKSASISDTKAKSVLEEAMEQVGVMAHVHRRLRTGNQEVSLGGNTFMQGLCDDLKASMARGLPITIECKADSRSLCMDQAVSLGLIVNELVTNAIKHAFPDNRSGNICVQLEAHEDRLHLLVADDGVGFAGRNQSKPGMGHDLVRGLSRQLGGELEVDSSKRGSTFRLSIPYVRPDLPIPSPHSIH
jgi:two-component sensor histidine kinase